MADAAAELEEGGMVRTFKDLFAGAAGGIAQVLLGKFLVQTISFRIPHSNIQLLCFLVCVVTCVLELILGGFWSSSPFLALRSTGRS